MQLVHKEKLYNASMKVNEFAKNAHAMTMAVMTAAMLTMQPMYAEDIFDKVGSFANSLYLRFTAISTVLGVVCVTIALVIRMLAKKQKPVDEANEWIKRIVISYVAINCMGLFINFIQPYISGAGWTYDGNTGGTSGGAEATTTVTT